MLNIIAALLVFSLIIIVHELGHFLLAKKNGITVVEFSIGMGPRLLSFDKNGTKYSVKAFPFGGSCMMLGEDEESKEEGAFNKKPVWARISVIVAGPIFNFLLAFVFSVIIIGSAGYDPAVLSGVIEGLPAETSGLSAGDTLVKLNNKKIVVYRDVTMYLFFNSGKTLDVVYERDGQKYETTIVPVYSEEYGSYMMGIQVLPARQKAGVLGTLRYAAHEVSYWIEYTVQSVGMLVSGQVNANELSGPVGIVSMIGETVEESKADGMYYVMLNLLNMCILLSANLGVMNLLPLPALDGGRLIFLLYEAIIGKPINRDKEGMVHMIGMVLLLMLMVFVMFNDIRRLF